ncbi:hypothetical protein JAAARDRAFT_58004 [Jaapia argillacea MUCL 33604]|uniref:2',3'-cyclic-nucleotide 3'-phosphodiesterase n=1 Tax=Jaapia argillacea MUCL 33604 TaxID=933084 RepID=A0A067PWP6_9AGAM|nr:hypothetical protein JAAARDRAFT_58004 [Jaapia argillacea MUCL 33604]
MARVKITLPPNKSHKSAVVLIPPGWFVPSSNTQQSSPIGDTSDGSFEMTSSIQNIRSIHDRHFHRWPMPHITLLYPFVHPKENVSSSDDYAKIVETLRDACQNFEFEGGERSLWLGGQTNAENASDGGFGFGGESPFGQFRHSKKSWTLFLRPLPATPPGPPRPDLSSAPASVPWLNSLMASLLSQPLLREYDEQVREGGRLPREEDVSDAALELPKLQKRVEERFQPHLSLGQWSGEQHAKGFLPTLNTTFSSSHRWDVSEVCISQRDGFEDPFRVVQRIPLGRPTAQE